MSARRTSPNADVVTLQDFRKIVKPENQPGDNRPSYRPVDVQTLQTARFLLEELGGQVPSRFMIVSAESHLPGDVAITSNKTRKWYAVRENRDDIEALTLDLEGAEDEAEQRLLTTIRRVYLLSSIARHAITSGGLISNAAQVTPPSVNKLTIRLEGDRLRSVTTWRAAAALSIYVCCRKRPSLHDEVRGHLEGVLNSQLLYMRSLAELSSHIGVGALQNEMFPDHLLGVCTPLDRFELRGVLGTNADEQLLL